MEFLVNAFEKTEEFYGMIELRHDGFFKDGDEFVEGSFESLTGSLGRRKSKDRGCYSANLGWCPIVVFEDADGAENSMEIVERRGEGCRRVALELRKLTLSPIHHNQNTKLELGMILK